MMTKEHQSREAVAIFLRRQIGLSRKKSLSSIKELESFGLLKFTPDGRVALRELGE